MPFDQWLSTPKEWYRLRPIAQARRKYPTPELAALWERLRKRQVLRLEFRRQEAIAGFLVDFFSYAARLAIVVDTPHLSGHLQQGAVRARCFEEVGVLELRFDHTEVESDLDGVIARIAAIAAKRRGWGSRRAPDERGTAAGGPRVAASRQASDQTAESTLRMIRVKSVDRRSPGGNVIDDERGNVREAVSGYERWRSTRRQWLRIKPTARALRARMTMPEHRLWQRLCDSRLDGLKFRRQHVIGACIVDFYCGALDLIIEVDGPVHDASTVDDIARDHYLDSVGLTVMHVTNDDVLEHVDVVVARIQALVDDLRQSPRKRHQPLHHER